MEKMAENRVRAAIKKWDQDQNYKDQSLSIFENSLKTFHSYLKSMCSFEASSAAGGNGAGDLYLFCEENLLREHIKRLAEQEKLFQ